jgi:hypothetical protein
MGIAEDDDFPRRRDPDDTILPVVMLKVEERLREDRHLFRNELAAIAAKQEAAQAQASAEHAILRADVARLKLLVEPIPQLAAKVTELDRHDVADRSREEVRAESNRQLWLAAGVVITALGVMQAFLPHFG